jgi:hypothetical protein
MSYMNNRLYFLKISPIERQFRRPRLLGCWWVKWFLFDKLMKWLNEYNKSNKYWLNFWPKKGDFDWSQLVKWSFEKEMIASFEQQIMASMEEWNVCLTNSEVKWKLFDDCDIFNKWNGFKNFSHMLNLTYFKSRYLEPKLFSFVHFDAFRLVLLIQ